MSADIAADIAILTETWLQHNEDDISKDLTPLGYNIISKPRAGGRRGGGVAVLYRDRFKCKVLDTPTYESFEHLAVSITSTAPPGRLIVAAIYRPPSSSIPHLLDDIDGLLHELAGSTAEIMVTGDVNIHMDDIRNAAATKLLGTLSHHSMTQHVSVPTHVRGHTLDIGLECYGSGSENGCHGNGKKEIT